MTYPGSRPVPTFRRLVFCIIALLAGFKQEVALGQEQPKDSVPRSVIIIQPRLNSTGYFPFTGAYLNNHINADINIFYNNKSFGFFLFQSRDLEDVHSYVNYFQPGIFKNINISEKFQMRAFFGYIFSQTDGFKDKDSDYYTALSQYWDISKRVRLENTMLFFDLTISKKMANRLLVSVLLPKDFKLDFYVWQRVEFENKRGATSASMAINFPKIKLSDKVIIQNTFSYQRYVTDAKPDFAMRDGFLFQIAVPLTINNY